MNPYTFIYNRRLKINTWTKITIIQAGEKKKTRLNSQKSV